MKKNSKRWKILVTPREACEALGQMPERLLESVKIETTHRRVTDRKAFADLIRDKDGVVLDLEPIEDSVLKDNPGLRVISRFGEGCDAIDLESALRRGVRVTRTRGVASSAVARHALSLILALTHHITENDRSLKKGGWVRKANVSEDALTLGIAGFGKIGERVAYLASVLGFKIAIYSRRPAHVAYKYVKSLNELFDMADVISVHLPLTDETRNIISKDLLKKLKGKYLVNTARGGIVDEEALLQLLNNGWIAGYAADVFSREPLSGISKKIAAHPRVIATPHIGCFDRVTAVRMTARALENAIACLQDNHKRVDAYVDIADLKKRKSLL